jgi:SAM-dependent methyltransferase
MLKLGTCMPAGRITSGSPRVAWRNCNRKICFQNVCISGGGEVFAKWTGELNSEPRADRSEESAQKEKEQFAFVTRKAEFLNRELSRIVSDKEMAAWRVLCLGCGGPTHQEANRFFQAKGCELLGIDTQDFNTLAFRKLFDADAILANAMQIPLVDDLFDAVVFTDVLEHLHDPLAGLKEIHRVLRPGGVLVLTTNNRHHHKHVRNPILLALMILGQRHPDWLPRRDIHQEWDGKVFHHTEFARRELVDFLSLAGFTKPRIRTNNFFSDTSIASRIGPRLAARIGLGEEFFVLARKSVSDS